MQRDGQIETYRFSRGPANGRAIPLSILGGKKEISRHRSSSDCLPRENGRRRNAQMQDYIACRSELVIIPRRAGKLRDSVGAFEIRSSRWCACDGKDVDEDGIRRYVDVGPAKGGTRDDRHRTRGREGAGTRKQTFLCMYSHGSPMHTAASARVARSRSLARARARADKCCIAIVHVHTYGSLHRSRYSR